MIRREEKEAVRESEKHRLLNRHCNQWRKLARVNVGLVGLRYATLAVKAGAIPKLQDNENNARFFFGRSFFCISLFFLIVFETLFVVYCFHCQSFLGRKRKRRARR